MHADLHPNYHIPLEKLPAKISNALSVDIKKKKTKSVFTKCKNKKGGFKKGFYRIKQTAKNRPKRIKLPEQPSVTTQFTGRAGEYAVIGELLFFGFNASIMPVDDGVDVVASKNGKYFHIQVKTAKPSVNGRYRYTIKLKAFGANDASAMFYILVLRIVDANRYVNEYLVIPSSEIRRLIDLGKIQGKDSIALTVVRGTGRQYFLNGDEDVSGFVNRFDIIK